MSVNFLTHRKKSDIFAPSKAIQDAKDKLGPMYFDISLLACSKNAVELTKLVNQWDDIEKKKAKKMKDLLKDQSFLVQKLKGRNALSKASLLNIAKETPSLGDVTNDAADPPGFRFHCNGEVKSTCEPPVVSFSGSDTHSSDLNSSGQSHSRHRPTKSDYAAVDYAKEIHELEDIIHEIYTDLTKSKINLYNISSGSYLRAHHEEFIPSPELVSWKDSHCKQHIDSTNNLSGRPKSEPNLRTRRKRSSIHHHHCVACEFKHQEEKEKLAELKQKHPHHPHSPYVSLLKKSSRSAHSGAVLTAESSSMTNKGTASVEMANASSKERETISPHTRKSTIRFADQEPTKNATPEPQLNVSKRTKSETSRSTLPIHRNLKSDTTLLRSPRVTHSGKATPSKSPTSSVPLYGFKQDVSLNSFSSNRKSRLSDSAITPLETLLHDRKERLAEMKLKQEEEVKHSNERVKQFLRSLQPENQSDNHKPIYL